MCGTFLAITNHFSFSALTALVHLMHSRCCFISRVSYFRFDSRLPLAMLRTSSCHNSSQVPACPTRLGKFDAVPHFCLLPVPLSHQVTSVSPTPRLLMGFLGMGVHFPLAFHSGMRFRTGNSLYMHVTYGHKVLHLSRFLVFSGAAVLGGVLAKLLLI